MAFRVPRRRRPGALSPATAAPGAAVPGAAARGIAALGVAASVLAGCGAAENDAAGSQGGSDGRLSVVTSTDVWGSVVSAVGGTAVEVTSLVDDPFADPHAYQSTPSDAADVLGADLVVFNGGGYDPFMAQILEAGSREVPAVEAVTTSDAHRSSGNEHVWYDLATVDAVADRVAAELGRLAPAQEGSFTANAESFGHRIGELAARLSAIRRHHAGTPVAVTEPIAFHLVADAGLTDVTPTDFVEAVEEGSDPPAAAFAQTRQLVSQRRAAVLVFNPQTRTPVTAQIRAAAEDAGVPVVEMTETLPAGTGYVAWMSRQIHLLEQALRP